MRSNFVIYFGLVLFASLNVGLAENWKLDGSSIVFSGPNSKDEREKNRLRIADSSDLFGSGLGSRRYPILLWEQGVMSSLSAEHPILMIDGDLGVLKRGVCWTRDIDIPLVFVQIKISTESLPAAYRSSWHYAAIVVGAGDPWPSTGRFYLPINGQNITVTGNDVEFRAPSARVMPIIWTEEAKEYGDKIPRGIRVDDKVEIREIQN